MLDLSPLQPLATRALWGSLALALAGTAAGLLAQLAPSRRRFERPRYALSPAPASRPPVRRRAVCVPAAHCCPVAAQAG